jgi:hypothetical protein
MQQMNFIGGRKKQSGENQELQRGPITQGTKTRYNTPTKQSLQNCRNCGGPFLHIGGKSGCPASGKKCYECGKIGHFGKHCMSKLRQQNSPQRPRDNHPQHPSYRGEQQQRHQRKDVRGLSEQQQSDTDEEFIYTITPSQKTPEITVTIAQVPVQVIIDTGSSVNILNHEHFKKINQQNPSINLQPAETKVFTYGAKHPLHLLGQFTADIKHNTTTTRSTFLVTKDNNTCLLSYNTSTGLGLLNINIKSISVDHPKLLKEKTKFHWGEDQQRSVLMLKQAITSAPILPYFSIAAPTRVVVDASPWGFPPATLEHFHLYLYGKSFEMETDHCPLEYIFKPKASEKPAPPRVERWSLRLQEYDFTMIY